LRLDEPSIFLPYLQNHLRWGGGFQGELVVGADLYRIIDR
jgi:hypothetical protein